MDEHKIKVFCTVAETYSFLKASEILRLTQPAVSLQIKSLEEILGTKLFKRSPSDIILTKAGKIFYKYAKEINLLYRTTEKEIGEFKDPVKGVIRIGASSTIGNYILPAVISGFKKKFPEVDIFLNVDNKKTAVDLINVGSVDIAIVEGNVKKQKLTLEKLIPNEMVFIAAPMHPLAKKSRISVFDITREPIIFRENGSGTREAIEFFLLKNGIHPQNVMSPLILSSTESIKDVVAEGIAVSIVSKWAVQKECRQGVLKAATFKEDKLNNDFYILYRKAKDFSFSLDKFLEFFKKFPFDMLLK